MKSNRYTLIGPSGPTYTEVLPGVHHISIFHARKLKLLPQLISNTSYCRNSLTLFEAHLSRIPLLCVLDQPLGSFVAGVDEDFGPMIHESLPTFSYIIFH